MLPRAALRAWVDVRFGSLADIASRLLNVRFTLESGHDSDIAECPLCAKRRPSALYSIISSARPSSGSGTVRPSALAVLRFTISSTSFDARLKDLELEPEPTGRCLRVCYERSGKRAIGWIVRKPIVPAFGMTSRNSSNCFGTTSVSWHCRAVRVRHPVSPRQAGAVDFGPAGSSHQDIATCFKIDL
jgi:hypothetical protein